MGIRATLLAFKPGQSETGPIIESLELDKSWHGIHFLLCGSAEPIHGPAGFLLNGEAVEDDGDAEVYLHAAEEVAAFDLLLTATTARELLDRYDPERMKALELYPALDWNQGDFDYLLDYVDRLRAFVRRHAELGHELTVLIC